MATWRLGTVWSSQTGRGKGEVWDRGVRPFEGWAWKSPPPPLLVIFILSCSPPLPPFLPALRHCPSTSPVPFCAGGGGWAPLPIPEFLPSKVLQPPQRCLLTSLLRPPALLQPRKQKIASCQIGILNSDHARNSLLRPLTSSRLSGDVLPRWAETRRIRRRRGAT